MILPIPVAFVFSMIGIFKDKKKGLAIAGTVLSGFGLVYLGGALALP
jgi:hypothetical protein